MVNRHKFALLCIHCPPIWTGDSIYVFTKLLRPLIQYWQQQGIRVTPYINDGIVAVEGKEEAKRTRLMVQRDLGRAGLVVNLAFGT